MFVVPVNSYNTDIILKKEMIYVRTNLGAFLSDLPLYHFEAFRL